MKNLYLKGKLKPWTEREEVTLVNTYISISEEEERGHDPTPTY